MLGRRNTRAKEHFRSKLISICLEGGTLGQNNTLEVKKSAYAWKEEHLGKRTL